MCWILRLMIWHDLGEETKLTAEKTLCFLSKGAGIIFGTFSSNSNNKQKHVNLGKMVPSLKRWTNPSNFQGTHVKKKMRIPNPPCYAGWDSCHNESNLGTPVCQGHELMLCCECQSVMTFDKPNFKSLHSASAFWFFVCDMEEIQLETKISYISYHQN